MGVYVYSWSFRRNGVRSLIVNRFFLECLSKYMVFLRWFVEVVFLVDLSPNDGLFLKCSSSRWFVPGFALFFVLVFWGCVEGGGGREAMYRGEVELVSNFCCC